MNQSSERGASMSLCDELEIDEQSQVGSMFMARVANEIKRAAAIEKSKRKLTQQAIGDKIGTSRAVVNREMSGVENLGARRIAELLWAMGWEPYFEARPIPAGCNEPVEAALPLKRGSGVQRSHDISKVPPRSEPMKSVLDEIMKRDRAPVPMV